MSILAKIKKNFNEGTLIKNGLSALKNRFIKKIKTLNFLYFFDKDRIKTKSYIAQIPVINANHIKAGNYYIDKRLSLNSNSVIYSLGILTDVSFDTYIANSYGSQLFMYDPTPISIEFMRHQKNDCFHFFPYGVWTEEATLKFFEPKLGGSASLFNESNDKNYFEAKCYTIPQLMQQNKHSHIDIFKADIEGAALPIIEQMVEQEIYPNQIVVEFERPRKELDQTDDFFIRIDALREKLKKAAYQEFLMPRKNAKYFSLELLFVKN